MNTVIERVEFQAAAPKRALPGLEYTINRLDALTASLKRAQAQMAGLSSNASFKLSARQFQDRAFNARGQAVLNVNQLARRLGFDPRDVRAAATLIETELQSAMGKINRRIQQLDPARNKRAVANAREQIKQLQGQSYFADASGRSFKNTTQAGKFFERYAGLALKDKQQAERALQAILGGGGLGPIQPGGSLTPAHLNKLVQDAAAAGAAAGKSANPKRKSAGAQKAHTASGDDVIETRTTQPKDETKPVRTVVKRNAGNGVVEETVHENDELIKTTVTDAVGRRAKQELQGQLTGLKQSLKEGLPATAGRPKAMKSLLADITRQADLLLPDAEAKGLGGLVNAFKNQTVVDVMRRHQQGIDRTSTALNKQRDTATAQSVIDDYRRQQAALAALDKQRQSATTKNFLQEEKRRQSAGQALDKQRQKETTKNFHQELKAQEEAQRLAAAQTTVAGLRAAGAERIPGGTRDLLTGNVMSERYRLGNKQYDVKYGGKGGARVIEVDKPPKLTKSDRLDHAIEGLGLRNMAANVVKVTAWSAAVGALYKTVELAHYSLERLIKTGEQTAHLGIVFRGIGGDARQLTSDIISLASAQGRETSEMMESATEWARLGGDRQTINEEVKLSAVAANIANIRLGESTKQLQSLMHIYGLDVDGLNTALGGLVNTSLKYNVTLDEMFVGLDRSAASAKVAKVSLAELQAMIGVVVGATGQTGSMTGNSLKYIFQELQKPTVQRELRGFGVEPLGNNLEMKPAGQILGELSGKWGTLGSHAQQQLSGLLGGRFNAARVPIVLEDYPRILQLAIDSQLNLNKAQEANLKILNTLKAQLAGVRAEFDQMVVSSGNKQSIFGGGTVMQQLVGGTRFIKNLMHLAGSVGSKVPGNYLDWTFPFVSGAGRLFKATGIPARIKRMAEPPGVTGQDDYETRRGRLQQSIGADALRQQALGIAVTQLRNGSMTQGSANIYAEILKEMDPARAAAFQNAYSGGKRTGNYQDAIGVLTDAQQANDQNLLKERQEAMVAAKERQLVLTRQIQELESRQADATAGHGKFSDQDRTQLEAYKRTLDGVKDKVDETTEAYQLQEGQIDKVGLALARYGGKMKAQQAVAEQIAQSIQAVSAGTSAGKLAQEGQVYQAQLGYWQGENYKFNATHRLDKLLPEDQELQKFIQGKIQESQQGVEAASDPTRRALARQLDRRSVRLHEMQSQGVGVDEADKLATERRYLEDIVKYSHDVNDIEAAKILLQNNALDVRLKQVDAEKEIKQLAIDQNKEFAKSVFGAGPAEILKKLAAFKLSSGGLSQGQMFSLAPGLRGDVGLLNGQNYEMSAARRNRNKLNLLAQGLPGFARGGYTGAGPAGEVAGVVHKGEYVLSQQELFDLAHDNLYPRGTRLLPGGGIYRAAGLALDNMDGLNRPRINLPAKLRMAANPMDEVRGFFSGYADEHGWGDTGKWGRFVRGGAGIGPDRFGQFLGGVRNWASQPRNWLGVGKVLGRGVVGAGITGALNYAGGRLGIQGSDTAGGALFHVGTDAAGGSVFGPAGAAVAAGIGLAGRLFGGVAGYTREVNGGLRLHGQVEAHQMALLRGQSARAELPVTVPQSAAAAADHARFASRMKELDARSAALDQKIYDAQLRPGVKAAPGTSLYRERQRFNQRGFKDGGYTGDGPADEVAGVVHRGEMVIPKKDLDGGRHDFSFVRDCEAALNSLSGAAGRVQAAFEALATRADRLFAGNGGMAFAAPGQSGGWYPGKVR